MKDCIVTSRGCYQWNPHLDCSVDVFRGQRPVRAGPQARSDAEKRSRSCMNRSSTCIDGRLLPQSASEQWVEGVSVRLHGQYRTAMLSLLELCKKWGESTRIVYAVHPRPGAGPLRGAPLSGRDRRAGDAGPPRGGGRIWHAAAAAMGCLHHAIEPGRAGSAYRQMRQADRNMEGEVSKLISALPDTEDTGACICDFETFKEIYRVQRGVQVRYGLQVFLAILTVAPGQNTDAAETCSDGGAAGRSDPHESAPVRCGRPLHRYAVCRYAERQHRRERAPARWSASRPRSTASLPMAATCSAIASMFPRPRPTAGASAAAKRRRRRKNKRAVKPYSESCAAFSLPWPPLRGGSARRRWGRELCDNPTYFGLWKGSLPRPCGATSLAEGGKGLLFTLSTIFCLKIFTKNPKKLFKFPQQCGKVVSNRRECSKIAAPQ